MPSYDIVLRNPPSGGYNILLITPAPGGGGSDTFNLRIGSITPSRVYLGTTQITRIYLGSTVVWDDV